MADNIEKEREEYLESRDNVLERSWVTELWMRVIQKAINDLALFTRMHQDGEYLSEENIYDADTAYSFLFNPDYAIMIGSMEVTVNELISIWGCEDPEGWREMTKEKVDELVDMKRQAVEIRRRRSMEEKEKG